MKVEALIRKYTASPRYKKLTERSRVTYTYALELIAKSFGTTPVKDIKRSDVIRLQTELESTPGTSTLVVRVFSVLCQYAMDLDLIPFNPASKIKKAEGGSHKKWTPEHVEQAIRLGDRKVSVAVALAWYTGQRESDILNMRWADIRDGYVSLIQQKTKLEMKIKMHPDLVRYLQSVRGDAPDDHYIVSGAARMSGAAFRNIFRRRMDKVESDGVFHGIRKGVASSLAERGRSLNEIAAIMGHKSLRMAAYYAEQANGTVMAESAVNALPSVQGPC